MSTNTYEEIVTELKRPTLVLAGPGAGKTYLLLIRQENTAKRHMQRLGL
jgi:superfamily I DNA/RNA helicase